MLTASFMDYAVLRSDVIPMIGFIYGPASATANPMGLHRCGEAGTVGAMAVTANAVADAHMERGVRDADMPFTP